jgi:hypothetical protein
LSTFIHGAWSVGTRALTIPIFIIIIIITIQLLP